MHRSSRFGRILTAMLMLFAGSWISAAAMCGAAEDPYAPWMQGRPAESVQRLLAQAQHHNRWSDWYDCGLAAAAAGQRGAAVYSLLRAYRQGPIHHEPLQALRGLGIAMPSSWCERVGVLAWPGNGWYGLVLLSTSGAILGLRVVRPLPRLVTQMAVICVLLAVPGALCSWHDASIPLLAVVDDSSLLDSTGNVLATVSSGTVVRQVDPQPWNGRVLVVAVGKHGWLPVTDTQLPAASP
jgi:hypothetical protein